MKRRDFIRNTSLGVALPSLFTGFNLKAFASTQGLEGLDTYDTDRVMVIIQLFGGNDGLNMVIPLDQYEGLASVRSNIMLPESSVLTLNGITETGLHPAMTGLQSLFNENRLGIVQSVGYPQPNFSHFRATDIWTSGSDSDEVIAHGWAGRYLKYEYPNYPIGYPNATMPDPLAIQIGGTINMGLISPTGTMASVVTNTNAGLNLGVNMDPVPADYAGSELEFLRNMAEQADVYSTNINAAASRVTTHVPYPTPTNSLAEQLKLVVKMIKGGLKTRIYWVQMGGFDTHATQVDESDHTTGYHAGLLKRVSDAIKVFMDDLEFHSVGDRVTGLVFSEFGRRIVSNGSSGTDHGAAGPLFTFGNKVQGSVVGANVEVTPNMNVGSNIPYQNDFRSVYASFLKQWFCVNDEGLNSILFRQFQELPIIESGVGCPLTDIHETNKKAGLNLVEAYPNPFTSSTTLKYYSYGGYLRLELMDLTGRVIQVLKEEEHAVGVGEFYFNTDHLPAGTYYVRYQNGVQQQVKTLMKVR